MSGYILNQTSVAWIQDNLELTDSQLSEIQSDDFVPTRLVRVDCEPPRLICPTQANGKSSFQYAALSYCWGPPEQAKWQLKTEIASLLARLEGINEHEMTAVLQDAIRTCRALSIPYLWIDALCIIQNDEVDWDQESAVIGKIYSNAYLTICPWSSKACTQGFLYRIPSQVEIPFQSKVKPTIHGSYSLQLNDIYNSEINIDIFGSEWDKRGWTLQEEIMSNRILALGRNKTHFLSWKHHQTQGDPIIHRSYMFHMSNLQRYRYGTIEECYEAWHDIIQLFSDRSLTHRKDRFPALSGLARHFSEFLKDEYIAGLWKNDLYMGLYWITTTDRDQSWDTLLDELSDPSKYVAPSWSWASRSHYVEFGTSGFGVFNTPGFINYQREYLSIETNLTFRGTDIFGQLRGASLRITTRICCVTDVIDPFLREYDNDKVIYVGDPKMPFACCDLDFRSSTLSGLQGETMMLLLGSAVELEDSLSSSQESSSDEDNDNEDEDDVEKEDDDDNDTEENKEEWEDDEDVDVEEEEEKEEQRDDANDDGDDDTDKDKRWAYGLLIHPVPGTDKFFRVGTFFSKPPHWGMRLFKDCPESTIVLI